jgi:S-(hydroxymethyl)glutathione dehydrogenase/alcohol dehydrogenase
MYSGWSHLCETWPLNIEGRLHNMRGQMLIQMSRVSGFSEYTVVHESQIVQKPPEMPLDRAALLSCGVITGFGAVVNRAQVKAFSSVAVIGTGGIGLNAVQGAAFSGAYPVIAVDISDSKEEAAMLFGANHTVNSRKEDAVQAIKRLTSGRGVEYVFVTGGGISAIEQGYAMSAKRGTVVLIALPPAKESPSFPFIMEFIGAEKTILGSFLGSTKLNMDIPRLVALYQSVQLKLDELITGRYPLTRINEAIESVERGEALRNVIIF